MNTVILSETKPLGVAGGSVNGGNWNLRELNVQSSVTNWCNLSAEGVFNLKNGKYLLIGTATALGVDSHKLRIRNIDNNESSYGLNSLAYSLQPNNSSTANITAYITIGARNGSYVLEHYCERTVENLGKGFPSNTGDNEVYSTLVIQRL